MRFTMDAGFHLLKRKTSYYVAIPDEVPGPNGRPRYKVMKSLKTLNKGLARKRALEVLADKSLVASKDDLADFLLGFWTPGQSEYLRSKAAEGKDISPVYCQCNRSWIERYFLPYFAERGITTLNKLDRRGLYGWRNHLHEHGRLKPDNEALPLDEDGKPIEPPTISPATQNKVRQAVMVALEWCVDMEMLPVNPMARVKRVAEKPAVRAIFQRDHLRALFAVPWPDYRSYAAALLAVTTGARLGEVRGLRSPSLHLDAGYIDIVENWQDGQGLKPPKWGSTRYGVPLPGRTIEALVQLESMNPYGAEDHFVFWGPSADEPIPKHIVSRNLSAAMKQAKIPATGRTFHSFRHTYVSLMRHEVGADRVRLAVGHTGTEMTDSYTHETDEDRVALRTAAEGLL